MSPNGGDERTSTTSTGSPRTDNKPPVKSERQAHGQTEWQYQPDLHREPRRVICPTGIMSDASGRGDSSNRVLLKADHQGDTSADAVGGRLS
jgi:hypothetical protein